jgi:hypothetical protein
MIFDLISHFVVLLFNYSSVKWKNSFEYLNTRNTKSDFRSDFNPRCSIVQLFNIV